MDPLNAVSLTIQAFEGVVNVFQIFENAAHADREYIKFDFALRIEYDKLQQWAVRSELHLESRYGRQMNGNKSRALEALQLLGPLLTELQRLGLRYEDLTETQPGINPALAVSSSDHSSRFLDTADPQAGTVDQLSDQLHAVLEIDKSGQIERPSRLRRVVKALHKPIDQPKRLLWAVRDGKKFNTLLGDVSQLIKILHSMLGYRQMDLLVANSNQFKYDMLQLARDVSDMKALLLAGQSISSIEHSAATLDGNTLVDDVRSQAAICSIDAADSTFRKSEAADSSVTSLWKAATEFSIKANERSVELFRSRRLGNGEVQRITRVSAFDQGLRTTAIMGDGRQAWIEWRPFQRTIQLSEDGSQTMGIPRDTIQRVETLVGLLQLDEKPPEFCIPRCLGYFTDDPRERFGLVFEKPPNTQEWPPTSLSSCFSSKRASLCTKVEIAQRLSQWLLYLHAVPWLHKGLRSTSILFFPGSNAKGLGQPYVSGFDYARIARDNSTTPGPDVSDTARAMYVHPAYLGPARVRGYRKVYDMYSLGVILVEIAHWKHIHEALGYAALDTNVKGAARDEPRYPLMSEIMKFRERLLDGKDNNVLEYVAEVMGDVYASATRVCLTGMSAFELDDNSLDSEPSVAVHLQQGFIERVVDELRRIVV